MNNYKEIAFEAFIEEQLKNLHQYELRGAGDYDAGRALDGEMVVRFIEDTQGDAWSEYCAKFNIDPEEKLLDRLDEEIASRGVLDVLRKGIEDQGSKFSLMYQPSDSSLNLETAKLYQMNILSVMRQVHFSQRNPNLSIDMVLFLNGMPIFTIELKNELTGQNVQNSMRQYREDRDPNEKLLKFKRCLVHFAVDTRLVYMTARLDGVKTQFLPFNQGRPMNGRESAAGNPVGSEGYATGYMWEDVWTRASVIELVGKFMTLQVTEKVRDDGRRKREEKLLFPRYHQRDAVRKLVADARMEGAGHNYLIQHSAGSGKSNTIAWTAHRLSELYDEAGTSNVFDSVIIMTDRRSLDKQLRDTVEQFSTVRGVVKKIEGTSQELKKALEDNEKIITTTIQKFGVIVGTIGEIPGKKFAIIVDEAHSSQSGESSKAVRQTLNADEVLDEAARAEDDSRAVSQEDIVNKIALENQRARRGAQSSLSIFAFTATPKRKTLEVFGTKQEDGSFRPFSLYSMRQAIEEGFILDVLQDYTTYRSYFELVKTWQQDDKEYEKAKAQRLLFGYVDRHKHSIDLKTKTIVEHFDQHIDHLMDGQAKAMVVTKSRLHAVRFKLAFDEYLREKHLPYKALVAFSDSVHDGQKDYTEAGMNGFSESRTIEEFKKVENKFLIVASKHQTGFDQPLLAAMYVDKKLGGVNAVQTLSRLNRMYPGKDKVFILDFVNETDDIVAAFQDYYTTTVLSEATDQNILYDLRRDIIQFKAFSDSEVEGFAAEYYLGAKPDRLNRLLDGVVERIQEHLPEETKDFKKKINNYLKKYGYVSQILTFDETSFEKLYIFLKFLKKKLPIEPEELPTEILSQVNIQSLKIVNKGTAKITLSTDPTLLSPAEAGDGGEEILPEIDLLSRIVKDVNDKYGTDFTEQDRLIYNNLGSKLSQNEALEGSIQSNARDVAKIKFDELFEKELVDSVNNHFDFYQKVTSERDRHAYIRDRMFDYVYKKVTEKQQ